MIPNLDRVIEHQLDMIRELYSFMSRKEETRDLGEKRIYAGLIISLKKRINLLNNEIPSILKNIGLLKKISNDIVSEEEKEEKEIFSNQKSRDAFLKELNISRKLLKKIKKKGGKKEKIITGYKQPGFYGKLANKIFLGLSNKLVKKKFMENLTLNIKRSNLNILGVTYISIMLFTSLISFFMGILISVFLLFFSFSLSSPYIVSFGGNYAIRILQIFFLPFVICGLTFFLIYFYPGVEKKSLGGRINQELPFVVIHMGSIAGSGIKPLDILKIIGKSKEYKYAGQEIRKLVNQTSIYGYDLSTALRNSALSTPSPRLSELFTGMSVTINSGGDIKKFFEKRAESLLLNYRLDREKATKAAETFMDLYISIVIATPMILLMILVMISVSGLQTGFGAGELAIALIGVVAIINILFITFLHLKQPIY